MFDKHNSLLHLCHGILINAKSRVFRELKKNIVIFYWYFGKETSNLSLASLEIV